METKRKEFRFVNKNGVQITIINNRVYAVYYLGDGVTFSKEFESLSDKKIQGLTMHDLMY